ncbi:MAG: NAD(P)-dependent oxidoreductase, partial [Spirochaetia bacterium]|nr:NAD(P)-dependent oxidoreductase [Spirochaetia bacterium]
MKVGLVGTGLMGFAMAEKILKAGHELKVYNKTKEKALPLKSKGALIVDYPAEAAHGSDVVISIVTDPNAVKQVSLGERGIRAGLSENSVHCDMSTVSASWAEEIEQLYVMNSKKFIHAPVLGSLPQIESASLLVFCGGKSTYQEILQPIFDCFAKEVWHFDSAKKAAVVKLSFNMMIAHMTVGLGQSMVFLQKSGIDP